MFLFLEIGILCSPGLHLIDKKITVIITNIITITNFIHLKMWFIPLMPKLNFQHLYSSLQDQLLSNISCQCWKQLCC